MRKALFPVWLTSLLLLGCSSGEPPPTQTASGDDAESPGAEPDSRITERRAAPEKDERRPGIPKPRLKEDSGGLRQSKWNPPPDLPHLESTPTGLRERIDDLIDTLFDPRAGRECLEAKAALIAIGKPAFRSILGRMARVRDEITDVDSQEDRLLKSSLKLADECLREMDGWLTAKGQSTLRPSSTKDYIQYIIRQHYKRWELVLKHMKEMPGPFDPVADISDSMANVQVIQEFLDHCELKPRVGGDDWLTDPDWLVGFVFRWSGLCREHPSQRALSLLARLPQALKARFSIGDLDVRGADPCTAYQLVRELTENEYVHLRKAADDCLKAIYDRAVSYDPAATLPERRKKALEWSAVIEVTEQLGLPRSIPK